MRNLSSVRFMTFLFCIGILLVSSCGSNNSTAERSDTKSTVSPEEQVRNYGKYFVEKLSANQLDSLKASYPDILNADSTVSVTADSIIVAETSPGQFDITFADGIKIKVKRSEDGNITVTESKGLFAFPADKLELAKKTGMWDDKLSDAQLNERMKDEDFFKSLNKNNHVSTKNILSVSKPHFGDIEDYDMDSMEGYQTITNHSDWDISGEDYYFIRHEYKMADWNSDDEYNRNVTVKGEDIPAHGSIKVELYITVTQQSEIKGIKWKLTPEQLQEKYASFKGNEYQEYLKSRK